MALYRIAEAVTGRLAVFTHVQFDLRQIQFARVDALRTQLTRYMNPLPCPACAGKRLRLESLAVVLSSGFAAGGSLTKDAQTEGGSLNIHELCSLPIRDALGWVQALTLTGRVCSRLIFLARSASNTT